STSCWLRVRSTRVGVCPRNCMKAIQTPRLAGHRSCSAEKYLTDAQGSQVFADRAGFDFASPRSLTESSSDFVGHMARRVSATIVRVPRAVLYGELFNLPPEHRGISRDVLAAAPPRPAILMLPQRGSSDRCLE